MFRFFIFFLLLFSSGCSVILDSMMEKGIDPITLAEKAFTDTETVETRKALKVYTQDNHYNIKDICFFDGKLIINDYELSNDKFFKRTTIKCNKNIHPNDSNIEFYFFAGRGNSSLTNKDYYMLKDSYDVPMSYSGDYVVLPVFKEIVNTSRKARVNIPYGEIVLYKKGNEFFKEGVNTLFSHLNFCFGSRCKTQGFGIKKRVHKFFRPKAIFDIPAEDAKTVVSDENGNFAIVEKNGIVHHYKLLNDKLTHVVSFTLKGEDNWVIWTRSRFFHYGALSNENLFPHFNIDKYGKVSFNQLFEVYHRPDLVRKELEYPGSVKIDDGGLSIIESLKNPPPKIKILSVSKCRNREAVIKIKVDDNGGGIGDVYTYHNGKLVDSRGLYKIILDKNMLVKSSVDESVVVRSVRLLKTKKIYTNKTKNDDFIINIADNTPDIKTSAYVKTIKLKLIPGENIVSLSAYNRDGSVQGQYSSTKINCKASTVSPKAYMVFIGINEFENKEDNLTYAKKDASDMAKEIYEKLDIKDKKIFILYNSYARKNMIKNIFEEIVKEASPEDFIVLYIASHGIYLSNIYWIPTTEYDGEIKPENTLSSLELVEFFKNTKALNQLFILDACQSSSMNMVNDTIYNIKTSELSRQMGFSFFAASSSYQNAVDGYQNNGLFTHFFLEGMKNNKNKSGQYIDLKKLGQYVYNRVNEKSNGEQTPVIKLFGNSENFKFR